MIIKSVLSIVATTCPSLSTPKNGSKTGCPHRTSEHYGVSCSFSCDIGYNLRGSLTRKCLENGTWSGFTSHCEG